MAYDIVLFDLDHTLFDSEESERLAFAAAMRSVGIDAGDDLALGFRTINQRLWRRVETGELTPNEVRDHRFIELFEAHRVDAEPRLVADHYVAGLGQHGDFYPGTIDVLDRVSAVATLALVTNGIGEVQRARIARLGLDRWFDAYVISGEVGISKPDPAIFDLAFDGLGTHDRTSALMVGDNLASDIAGGAAAGIDTAWIDPDGRSPNGAPVTLHLESLADLVPHVVGS